MAKRKKYKLASFITFGLILSVFLGLKVYAQVAPQEDTLVNEQAVLQEEQVQAEQPIQAEAPQALQTPNENSRFDLIYSLPEQRLINKEVITKTSSGISKELATTYADQFAKYKKELFLSPNRKLMAVELDPNPADGPSLTYIADIAGNRLTDAHIGSFGSWSPDSQKVLLYLSIFYTGDRERHINILDINNSYYDSGLPKGVINADISPKDGSIAYAITERGTDKTKIYKRNTQGNDTLLIGGEGNIFSWVRWSPNGDKMAFMKSDLAISSGQQSVWTINSDGTGPEKVSDVVWSYPPVWSPDASKIAFANAGNIWEYNVSAKTLNKLTNFDKGSAMQPNYSQDGKTTAFISNFSGQNQVWMVKNGQVDQLTNDNQEKGYPILP